MPRPTASALGGAQHRFVMACLFMTGAVTLTLEIVGTRVISPFYGSSIATWSALITVTLVALAAGYELGGRAADRGAGLALFSRLLFWAGAAVLAVPLLRSAVLRLSAPLGVQAGALASAAVLIAPALVLLSMLGPLAIRLTAAGLDTVGRRAGGVYAVSTVGSVAGAILSGFVLIPRLPMSRVFYGTAVLLFLLSALARRLSGRSAGAVLLAAAVALAGFWPRTLPRTNVLVNRESAYGQIKVVDLGQSQRYLLVNGTSQSVARLPDMESESQYIRALEWAPLARPRARRALVIGVGAGLLPSAWERRHGLTVDAVDIDPDIVAAAREHFAYRPRGQVFIEDGRLFLERRGDRYGLIALDAFSSESPPYHLFSREALSAMRRRLEPGGMLAVNIVSLLRAPGDEAWLSVHRTLRTVFPEVRAFAASDEYQGLANVLLFASDAPLQDDGASRRAPAAAAADIRSMLARELVPAPGDQARARELRDDFAPLESLLARTAKLWRRSLQGSIPAVMLY
ncbi:MAG: fused MFS/spermidine synthase [Elusimicrobia bacterium]|nr:fused MFS/spermidine synthase [Elusimicrobiota bacterium]